MLILSLLACLPLPQVVFSQKKLGPTPSETPVLEARSWSGVFGGAAEDWYADAAPDGKGGLFLAGSTFSFGEGLDDGWIARIKGHGTTRWERALGGPGADSLRSVAATPDGGCIVAGSTSSFGAGGTDGWLIKLGPGGAVLWEQTYGGAGLETFEAVAVVPGAGPTAYYVGGMLDTAKDGREVWVLALDASGTPLWQNTYGGKGHEDLTALVVTPSGPAFVARSSSSLGGPAVTFERPWLVRLDSAGFPIVQRTFNFTDGDILNDLIYLPDGSFATTGEIKALSFQRGDVWVQHLDAAFNVLWGRALGDNFGANWVDSGRRICATSSGDLLVVGSTGTAGAGSEDLWLLQFSSEGSLLADRTLGGTGFDNGLGVVFDPRGLAFVAGRLQPEGASLPFDISISRVRSEVLLAAPGTTCPPALGTQPASWTPTLQILSPAVPAAPTAITPLPATSTVMALDTLQHLCR